MILPLSAQRRFRCKTPTISLRRWATLLGLCCFTLGLSAEVSSVNAIISESYGDLPAKPANLAVVPRAKVESESESPYALPVKRYLEELLMKAERPQITQGASDYKITVAILEEPVLAILPSSNGKKANGWDVVKKGTGVFSSLGGVLGGTAGKAAIITSNVTANINFLDTNIDATLSCRVGLQLLDGSGLVKVSESPELRQTNKLAAFAVELAGIPLGGGSPENVVTFLSNLTNRNQTIAKLAAYYTVCRLLPKADQVFLQGPPSPPPAVAIAQAPVPLPPANSPAPAPAPPETDLVTPAQAATILQVPESDVMKMIDKNELKAKHIGPLVRLSRKENGF